MYLKQLPLNPGGCMCQAVVKGWAARQDTYHMPKGTGWEKKVLTKEFKDPELF